jgi:hypothetical protein
MGLTLASLISVLIGLGFVLLLSTITEPPWELFRPASHGLASYFLELVLAVIVFVMVSGLALGALSSI